MAEESRPMNLTCVNCLIKGRSSPAEAVTIYHGMALCLACLKVGHKTKKEKLW